MKNKRLLIYSVLLMIFLFVCFSMEIFAQMSQDEEIPEGMELKEVGKTKILMPKGSRVKKVGKFYIVKTLDRDTQVIIDALTERVDTLEKKQLFLEEKIQGLTLELNRENNNSLVK